MASCKANTTCDFHIVDPVIKGLVQGKLCRKPQPHLVDEEQAACEQRLVGCTCDCRFPLCRSWSRMGNVVNPTVKHPPYYQAWINKKKWQKITSLLVAWFLLDLPLGSLGSGSSGPSTHWSRRQNWRYCRRNGEDEDVLKQWIPCPSTIGWSGVAPKRCRRVGKKDIWGKYR